MAGHPGGGHAVELVDPEGHRLDEPERVAHPHEVPGTVGREERAPWRPGRPAWPGGARPPRARRCRSRRTPVPPCAGRSPPAAPGRCHPGRSRTGPAPRDGRRGDRGDGGPARPRPRSGRRPPAARRRLGRERGAHVEHHLDVGPEEPLGLHGRLRGEPDPLPVVDRGEGHPVVVHAGPEGVYLVPAGVGQGVPGPSGEPVEATQAGHGRRPGPEHQVVGVGQDHLRPRRSRGPGCPAPSPLPGYPPA